MRASTEVAPLLSTNRTHAAAEISSEECEALHTMTTLQLVLFSLYEAMVVAAGVTAGYLAEYLWVSWSDIDISDYCLDEQQQPGHAWLPAARSESSNCTVYDADALRAAEKDLLLEYWWYSLYFGIPAAAAIGVIPTVYLTARWFYVRSLAKSRKIIPCAESHLAAPQSNSTVSLWLFVIALALYAVVILVPIDRGEVDDLRAVYFGGAAIFFFLAHLVDAVMCQGTVCRYSDFLAEALWSKVIAISCMSFACFLLCCSSALLLGVYVFDRESTTTGNKWALDSVEECVVFMITPILMMEHTAWLMHQFPTHPQIVIATHRYEAFFPSLLLIFPFLSLSKQYFIMVATERFDDDPNQGSFYRFYSSGEQPELAEGSMMTDASIIAACLVAFSMFGPPTRWVSAEEFFGGHNRWILAQLGFAILNGLIKELDYRYSTDEDGNRGSEYGGMAWSTMGRIVHWIALVFFLMPVTVNLSTRHAAAISVQTREQLWVRAQFSPIVLILCVGNTGAILKLVVQLLIYLYDEVFDDQFDDKSRDLVVSMVMIPTLFFHIVLVNSLFSCNQFADEQKIFLSIHTLRPAGDTPRQTASPESVVRDPLARSTKLYWRVACSVFLIVFIVIPTAETVGFVSERLLESYDDPSVRLAFSVSFGILMLLALVVVAPYVLDHTEPLPTEHGSYIISEAYAPAQNWVTEGDVIHWYGRAFALGEFANVKCSLVPLPFFEALPELELSLEKPIPLGGWWQTHFIHLSIPASAFPAPVRSNKTGLATILGQAGVLNPFVSTHSASSHAQSVHSPLYVLRRGKKQPAAQQK
eukprot:TRINITY_DN17666_c0_g1_i1.p1 TRINITY_DN17666_c0_g1~~TRINITY_DN17666_c0_g1_i1.p1  ORF type:complete len:813 (-),score=190.57 TRINITY_DN17666_c0_g1_i1:7-2445(-)